MDNLDESENNAKVSDSAYSNSCSNSQSRRSHSSKSTHSGASNSSGSSGYGGKQSTSGSSKTLNSQIPEKRTKDKDGKKKKQQSQTELVKIEADVEFRLPDPATVTEVKKDLQNASPPLPTEQTQVQRSSEAVKEVADEKPDNSITPQPTMQILADKPSYSEGFSCVISMHDGVVLYMSTSLTATLGFSQDMWVGRSFIDFVHPSDHATFASQITSGLAIPKEVNGMQDAGPSVSTMFCRIRRYRALTKGFNIKERSVTFMPFMLKLSFKNVYEEKGSVIYLVIQATALFSAYKVPNEVIEDAVPFVMRHVANCNVEYIDTEAVPLLGYLPQDVTGQDVLNLYHPEDLAYVRHVYENIVKQGKVPRSKPYRMLAQNGDYLKLETEWSSFINPWSRKLEFVIGRHHVVEGPANPDVFQAPPTLKNKVPDEDIIEIEGLKDSIVRILNEVPTRPAELVKQQMTKRCQDLASIMESLVEEQPMVEDELRLEIQENDNSYYERDSVMLGGISPHHDYSDSKSSTGTPLSYNRLNYNINLKRYFDSHQDAFDEGGTKATDSTLVPVKGQNMYIRECLSPMAQYSGDSMESACLTFEESPVTLPHEFQSIRLTESILTKHNSDMEKIFVKKHRGSRLAKKEDREKLSNESKQKKRDHIFRCNASYVPSAVNSVATETQPHGLKRASKPWDSEAGTHKQHCASSRQMRRRQLSSPTPVQPAAVATVSTTTTMWPQNFVNGMNPFMSQQMPVVSPVTAVSGFVPMYYLPTAAPSMPCTSEMNTHNISKPNSSQMQFQPPAVQYMMYGQAVFGSPIMVSPINHQAPFSVQQNVMHDHFANVQNNLSLTTRNYEEACKPGLQLKSPGNAQLATWRDEKRAAGTATLPAASSRCGQARSANTTSICSATDALNRSNEAVPESRDSKTKSEEGVNRTDGESSYSSFYSSFFKTESGSAEESGDAEKKQNKANSSGVPSTQSSDNPRSRQTQRRKKGPPWMEQVCVTSELIYKYQVLTKSLDEVLVSDKQKLVGVEQPSLVNEQLGQLYTDLQLEGVAARLTLEEGITSSGSSSEEGHKIALDALAKRARRKRKYSKLVMIYEEDAPLPSPEEEPEPQPSTSLG